MHTDIVVEEVAGSITPFAACASFMGASHPVLLDSGMAHEGIGRYSYLAADPSVVLRSKGRAVGISEASGGRWRTHTIQGDPFLVLRHLLARRAVDPLPDLPPFQGGAIGYFAYELGHHLERLPHRAKDDLGLPEMYLGFYDWVLAHDHQAGRSFLMARQGEGERPEHARVACLRERLLAASCRSGDGTTDRGSDVEGTGLLRGNSSRAQYLAVVARVKEHIAAGDIYQACMSQRFEAEWRAGGWPLYQRLRQVNPAPFGAYLGFEGMQVVSASPEQFLKLEGRQVETRPMKGTRPRGLTPMEDARLEAELAESEKDRAENVMITDLLRNDIGRVCRTGSVHVPELWTVEKYPTVWQMVSTVRGELAEGRDGIDLLRACFPGGSITGAPKIRAMEILDDLEPTQRSVYCGAIGYLGDNGNMNTSVAIRTLIARGDRVYFQVGGGIVADSDPEAEYQETLDKARASVMALQGTEHDIC